MKRMAIAACLVMGCATAEPKDDDSMLSKAGPKKAAKAMAAKPVEMPVSAEARLDPVGSSTLTGSARFAVDRGVVTLDLTVNHAPQGVHAVALQDSCDGEHWNPTNASHGRFDVPPFHLGDVGNFFANPNGQGSITFTTELWSVGTGLANDVVGKMLVVHEKKDDFSGQPAGNSGNPVSCGRIDISQLTQPAVSMTGRLTEPRR